MKSKEEKGKRYDELSDRPALGAALVVAAVAWLVLGIGIPAWGFGDTGAATGEHLRRLKTEAAHRAQVPRVKLQAVEAEELSPDPYAVAGVVVWRGPFGIELGRAGIGEDYADEPYSPGSPWWAAGVWAAFAGVAMALLALAGKLAI